jgi:acyltransferase
MPTIVPHSRPQSTLWVNWIDWLKALGIIAVVFGHIASGSALTIWIYSFHMPLFFAVSGYLLKPDHLSEPLGVFGKRVLIRLLPAYLTFGGLGILHTFALASTGGVIGSPIAETGRSAIGLLLGSDRWSQFPLNPGVLWFFPALIMGQITFFLVLKIKNIWACAIVVIICFSVGVLSNHIPTPWSLGSAFVALPFIILGHWFRVRRTAEQNLISFPKRWGFIAIAIGALPSWWGHSLDLRSATVGLFWLTIPVAVLTLGGLVKLTHHLSMNRLIRLLSLSSVTIFALHPFVIWGIDTTSRFSGINLPSIAQSDFNSLLKTMIVVSICLTLHPATEKVLSRFR